MGKILFVFLLTGVMFTTGCTAIVNKPTRVILKHPETLDYVKCKVDDWGTPNAYAENDQCIKSYQEKGYVIWEER